MSKMQLHGSQREDKDLSLKTQRTFSAQQKSNPLGGTGCFWCVEIARSRFLVSEVSERLVGVCHLVHVFALRDRFAFTTEGSHELFG